ncbi:tetratricopeptide repeat protein [Candidatus Margulisiibacteriota bacterium]
MSKKSILLAIMICVLAANVFGIAKISKDILFEHAKYKYMVEKNPEDAWAHFNLAITYAYMGKVELGLKELGEADRLDKEFAPKAIARYTRKVEEKPQSWQARFRLAFAYYFGGEKDNALKELQNVVSIKGVNGKNAWAYGYMAIIYGEQEKWDKAVESCKKGLRIEPDAAAIHLALAQALLKKGNGFSAASELFVAFRLQAEEKKYERKNRIRY